MRARLSIGEELRAGLRVLPALLRFGLKATPGQIAIGASQQGGIWAIGIVAPAAAVGAYSRAFLIPRNVQQASTQITDVLFPTLVGRRSGGDHHGFDRALIDSIRYEVSACCCSRRPSAAPPSRCWTSSAPASARPRRRSSCSSSSR